MVERSRVTARVKIGGRWIEVVDLLTVQEHEADARSAGATELVAGGVHIFIK